MSIFADSLLNILKYLKDVPKKINPKNGKVIESTLYINLIKKLNGSNMSAYAIFQINILNKDDYKEYVEKVSPIVKKFNGEYIVRGGKSEIIEGKWNYERTVVVRFPDYETAINWYNSNEYSPIKEIRKINSEGNAIIVDGI